MSDTGAGGEEPHDEDADNGASSTQEPPEDPFQTTDPWARGDWQRMDQPTGRPRGSARDGGSEFSPGPNGASRFRQRSNVYSTQSTSQPSVEPPPQRIIHDVPPPWDGTDPDNQLEPYLKLLQGWLNTTRTLGTQHGMTIMHYAGGDLKTIINELSIEDLTDRESGQIVVKHIQSSFREYTEHKLPKAIERAQSH